MSTNNPNNKLQSHWILPANITAILECIYQFTVPLKGECTRRCGQLKCRENDEKQWDLGGFL